MEARDGKEGREGAEAKDGRDDGRKKAAPSAAMRRGVQTLTSIYGAKHAGSGRKPAGAGARRDRGGRAGERGGSGDARGGFGGSVCRRVNAAGRLTVVSRASRRGGDEDLPTQVAGRSRHCSKNVAASKNALSAPAVRWFQGERTRACRLYTRGGSLNAGLSLSESTRDDRVTRSRPVASTCARRELASPGRRSCQARCQPKKSHIISKSTAPRVPQKRTRGVHTDTVTR